MLAKVVLVARNAVQRHAVGHLLCSGGFDLAHSVASVDELHAAEREPAIVVVCGGRDSLDDIGLIRRMLPQSVVVILGGLPSRNEAMEAIERGANAWLDDATDSDSFLKSLSVVGPGRVVLSISPPAAETIHDVEPRGCEPLARATGKSTPNGSNHSFRSSPLSARETAILHQLRDGAPNKMIARNLSMTEATVKVHLKAILRKIQVSNRTQAAIWAVQNGHAVDQTTSDDDPGS